MTCRALGRRPSRAAARARSVVRRALGPVVAATLTLGLLAGCGAGSPADGPLDAAPPPTGATARTGAAGSGGTAPAVTADPSAGAGEDRTARQPRVRRTARVGADVALDAQDGFAVTPLGTTVDVHESPDGPVQATMPTIRETGAPLTFLLDQDTGDGWYRVLLPVRPNGSTGWVEASAVTVARVPYSLQMSTATNELRLYEGTELVRTMPAASGTGDTPTPLGRFYLTELLEPTNPGYGPYAYGTSGFSEVLTSFGGGPGQVGLHGTDDAGSVGRSVSNGCIRLSDEDITYLAELLPLGTPVEVR